MSDCEMEVPDDLIVEGTIDWTKVTTVSTESIIKPEVRAPGILPAQLIRQIDPPVFEPFVERSVAHGMSYGLGPAGYDIRLAESFIMWPGRFVLASSIEYFRMPNWIVGTVTDKSTWARRGICVQNTVIEPGWEGYLTLEITLHAWRPVRLKAGMPIAQILLNGMITSTEAPYSGKYQHQEAGPQKARLER